MNRLRQARRVWGAAGLGLAIAAGPAGAAVTNEFFAMDTGTKRPYPKNDIPPAEQLDLLKELGYAGIAWTLGDPAETRKTAEEAEARGLKMHAIYCGVVLKKTGCEPHPQLRPTIEALKGRGTVIWLHITSPDFPKSSADGDAAAVPGLRELADLAATNGLRVAIYPHLNDWTERIQDAVRVAKAVDRPNFGVTFNLCHWLRVDGQDLDARLREAAPHLFCVTVNGASPDAGKDWGQLIQTLDKGTYDVGALLRTLSALGYGGPVGLQLYGVGGDRRDNLKRSIEAWRRITAAPGGASTSR